MCSSQDNCVREFLELASCGPPGIRYTYEIRFRLRTTTGQLEPPKKEQLMMKAEDDLREQLTDNLWPTATEKKDDLTEKLFGPDSAAETSLEEIVRRQQRERHNKTPMSTKKPVSPGSGRQQWTEKSRRQLDRQQQPLDVQEVKIRLMNLRPSSSSETDEQEVDSDYLDPNRSVSTPASIGQLLDIRSSTSISTGTSSAEDLDLLQKLAV